jgi:hypothetical protein
MPLRTVFLAALLAAPACSKANDLPVLQESAVAIVKYNRPKLDAFQQRFDAISRRLADHPPSSQDVAQVLAEVRKGLSELHEKDRTIEAEAASLAKDGKAEHLANLVDKTAKEYEDASIVMNDDLNALESWVSRAEAHRTSSASAPPPVAPASPDPAPADPSN